MARNLIVIINFIEGGNVDDETIRRNGRALWFKAEGAGSVVKLIDFPQIRTIGTVLFGKESVTPEEDPREARQIQAIKAAFDLVRKDVRNSKVVLNGHGDDSGMTMGGWDGAGLAKVLAAWGLPSGVLVTIIGCQSGGLRHKGHDEVMKMDSFASEFHKALGEEKINVDVYARVLNVTVVSDELGSMKPDSKNAHLSAAQLIADKTKRPKSELIGKKLVGIKIDHAVQGLLPGKSRADVNSAFEKAFQYPASAEGGVKNEAALQLPTQWVKCSKLGFRWRGGKQIRFWVERSQGIPGLDFRFGEGYNK
jgi:hypothetical protein